jgi:micrococcal nuclease
VVIPLRLPCCVFAMTTKFNKHFKSLITAILIVSALFFLSDDINFVEEEVLGEGVERAFVKGIVDGDTIVLSTDERVRYIGIDTPESKKPNTPVECFAKEATLKNAELVEGKNVEMEMDVNNTDKYGRLLRYVWVGDLFVNEELVRQGYASAAAFPPDVRYQELFSEAEKDARENNRGLWGKCKN